MVLLMRTKTSTCIRPWAKYSSRYLYTLFYVPVPFESQLHKTQVSSRDLDCCLRLPAYAPFAYTTFVHSILNAHTTIANYLFRFTSSNKLPDFSPSISPSAFLPCPRRSCPFPLFTQAQQHNNKDVFLQTYSLHSMQSLVMEHAGIIMRPRILHDEAITWSENA